MRFLLIVIKYIKTSLSNMFNWSYSFLLEVFLTFLSLDRKKR